VPTTDRSHSLLLTDLYELTMAAAFFENGFNPTASFELFVRQLPKDRGYLVAAGLEQALEWIQSVRCDNEDIHYLRQHQAFTHVSDRFFDFLADFRFTGDVWAVPEGTAVFGEEPVLRITGPLIEAQVLETYLLASITYPTMVAAKSARIVEAAKGREVLEFGSRRAHGPEAGVTAARAAYIAGCAGTSNVEAGARFGIPTFGTIAHSFIMAMQDELDAFQQYIKVFPENSVLLIDTYDTLAAADNLIAAGLHPSGVRIDSGDLARLSKEVRRKLDAAGLQGTRILVSGDLDEFKITELLANDAEIEGFGVGTALVTSQDAPSLSGVYKLVEVSHKGHQAFSAKFSPEKMTHPGTKQVYRLSDDQGNFTHDVIACAGETVAHGTPLLRQVLRNGALVERSESLEAIRARAQDQIRRLPESVRRLRTPEKYPVSFSNELNRLLEKVRHAHEARRSAA
jgi:nicotinate phosphoribosyltransferase